MSRHQELEFKYRADEVSLQAFIALIGNPGLKRRLDISSWDTYYTNADGNFIRCRHSATSPELTIKRKNNNTNNWDRVEVDLKLAPVTDGTNSEEMSYDVDRFCDLLGYQKDFKIYKSCFIFWHENVNYVYYIVYDEDMQEQGRFVEVEVTKTEYYESDPQTMLLTAEQHLAQIGLSPRKRLKKSLFEMYRSGK